MRVGFEKLILRPVLSIDYLRVAKICSCEVDGEDPDATIPSSSFHVSPVKRNMHKNIHHSKFQRGINTGHLNQIN
jgi:hypothetical protein